MSKLLIQIPFLVVFGLSVAAVVVVFIKMITGQKTLMSREAGSEDLDTLLEIQHGLELMEQRIEALETILLDRDYTARRR